MPIKSRFPALRRESSYRQNRNESAPNSHTRHQNSHTFHHTVRRPFADAAGVRHDDHRHHPPRGRPMTRASPARIARRHDRGGDSDLLVAETALAFKTAWGLSERVAIDYALALHRGKLGPASKIPRGAKAG